MKHLLTAYTLSVTLVPKNENLFMLLLVIIS